LPPPVAYNPAYVAESVLYFRCTPLPNRRFNATPALSASTLSLKSFVYKIKTPTPPSPPPAGALAATTSPASTAFAHSTKYLSITSDLTPMIIHLPLYVCALAASSLETFSSRPLT